MVAMGQRHVDRRRRGEPGGDAVDDLDLEAERAQVRDFLAAAPEHERIAALEANDALAAHRLGRHQALDEGLRRARAAAALADLDDARRAARVAEHAGADEVVDEQHRGLANRRGSPSPSAAPGRRGRRRPGGCGGSVRSRLMGSPRREPLAAPRGPAPRCGRGGAASGRHEPHWVPHFSSAWMKRSSASLGPLRRRRRRRAATISRSLTSKQVQTWRPRDAIGHRRVAPGDEKRAPVRRGRELLLQQRPDPRFGGDVAGEQEPFEPASTRHCPTGGRSGAGRAARRRSAGARRRRRRRDRAAPRSRRARRGATGAAAAARNSTPVRSRPNGTQLANANSAISGRNASRTASARSSLSQASARTRAGSSARATFTAACLSSGCFDCAQNAGWVSALTPARRAPPARGSCRRRCHARRRTPRPSAWR